MDVHDPGERLVRLAEELEPAFRAAFLAVVATIRDSFTIAELESLIMHGRVEEALELAEQAAERLGLVWSESFVLAGRRTASFVNAAIGEVIFDFDQTNEFAVAKAEANRLRLVREFSRIQRETTRAALLEGTTQGLNPRAQARIFRDSIGLTRKQEQWVRNYRNSLEMGSVDALQRQLRDRRFDRTVAASIRDKTPLSQAQINKMVERYRERMIKYRSEVIARTEALRSVHQGTRDMYFQAFQKGLLQEEGMQRTWETAKNERVRHSHRAMHGQERAFDQPFKSGLGNLIEYPCDPNAPGEDSIQCRCSVAHRITIEALPGLVSVSLVEEDDE